MTVIKAFIRPAQCAALLSILGSVSFAGDGNQIYILQNSPLGIAGNNELQVDQTQASNATVAGAFDAAAGSTPALQDGTNNYGQILMTGNGGQVAFLQSGDGNNASVSMAAALGLAYMKQDGNDNTATLTLAPLASSGDIRQIGNGNRADLNVTGEGASGSLTQIGDNNQFGLTVSGAGANASYTAIGNNLAPVGTGPVVISNGGSVTITQTQF